MRVGLLGCALILTGVLAAQLALQDRDRLATTQPALRPLLQALCQTVGCVVGPVRQIESVVIDSSAFNRLRADVFRLRFSVRNGASIPLAAPALELTLTDAQDQPVLRRVFLPAQLGWPGILAGGGEAGAALNLGVDAPAGARIAGYRLLIFYP